MHHPVDTPVSIGEEEEVYDGVEYTVKKPGETENPSTGGSKGERTVIGSEHPGENHEEAGPPGSEREITGETDSGRKISLLAVTLVVPSPDDLGEKGVKLKRNLNFGIPMINCY